MYARTHHTTPVFSPAHLPGATKKAISGSVKNNQAFHKAASSNLITDGINATEMEDDDDFEASRKYLEISGYFLNFLHAQVSGDAHRYLKDRLPFCEHFSFTASDKHIVQRAIRI